MTESQIRSNITYNQNILDELYMEKSKIESQLYELDLLRDKVFGLQQRFGDDEEPVCRHGLEIKFFHKLSVFFISGKDMSVFMRMQ